MIYTFIALMFYAVGEYYSKMYANTSKGIMLGVAMLAYTITTLLWFPSIKNNNHLIVMTFIWDICYVIIGFILGYFVFHETLSSKQWIGIMMGIASIALLVE